MNKKLFGRTATATAPVASAVVYRTTHKAQIAAASRKWQRENPDKIRLYNARARARRRSCVGLHYGSEDVLRLLKEQNGLCCYCSRSILDKFHVEHIVPLARGGGNGADNIALACPSCNTSKKDKLLGHEWCHCGEAQRSNVWA